MKNRKWLFALVLVAFATPNSAQALFLNGGFEDGTFNGWTLEFGQRDSEGDTKTIYWGQPDHGSHAVIDSSATMPGQTQDVDPYNGNYMARINDIEGNYDYNATRLSQTDTITQADIDSGAMLYVNWGTMLIEPENQHPKGAQPYFSIEVFINNVLTQSFDADALEHDATWQLAGNSYGDLWYKHDTWSFPIGTFNPGDAVKLQMTVSDCGWGGHGGYAFLDGIGTVYQAPNTEVPEPASMLLLGSSVIGALKLKRRRQAIM